MSDMRSKEKARKTRTERELDKLGEGSSVKKKKKVKKKAPAKKLTEKAGVGRDHSNENKTRLMRDLDSRLAAARAANNTDLVNKYTARKNALREL
jgi:hypothetical protein